MIYEMKCKRWTQITSHTSFRIVITTNVNKNVAIHKILAFCNWTMSRLMGWAYRNRVKRKRDAEGMQGKSGFDLDKLISFFKRNLGINLRSADALKPSKTDQYDWTGLESDKETLIIQLKVYQLLLLIVPENREDLVLKMLYRGILSPVQIANTPKDTFIEDNINIFDANNALAEHVHLNATKLLKKVSRMQQTQAQTMSPKMDETTAVTTLNAFLEKNKNVDFRIADLLHQGSIDALQWAGFEDKKDDLIDSLKAYQRMLRVVPPDRDDLAQKLLENGFQSSLQIANTPKKVFIKNTLELFDNNRAIAENVYIRSIAIRKAIALQYIDRVQQTEAHVRLAGLQLVT